MAHSIAPQPRRLPFRETPTTEALAFDRWAFGAALGGAGPRDGRVVRPGAFGLFFDVPPPLAFDSSTVGADGIACLRIAGPLEHHAGWWTNYEDILTATEAALACPQVTALVHRYDTPGGVCAGMLSTHRALLDLRRRYAKPLVAYVDEMAASAGYGLASACSEIWLPPEGVVGSIGVILCTVDESARLEKEGVRVRYVVTGDRKADLHPGSAITSDVLEVAQRKVDELGAQFFRTVARARGTTSSAVSSLQAAVFSGQSAVDVGLADGVADWSAFLGTLRAAIGAMLGTRGTLDAAA